MRMRFSMSLLCLAVFALAALAWGQPMYPRVEVDFQHPVNVGQNTTLQPGHYIFQQVRGTSTVPVFRVVKPNGENVTLTAVGMSARVPQSTSSQYPPAANSTDVVLQKIGSTYYLDKIWVQGRSRGWAFDIPESAKSQASQMQQETVAGTYSEANDTTADNNNSSNQNSSEQQANMNTSPANTSAQSTSDAQNTSAMQNTSAQNSQSRYSSTQNMPVNTNSGVQQEQSLSGCLQRASSPNSYYLQGENGSQEAQLLPAANLDSQMADQVGHTVRLIGQWTGNTVPNSSNSQAGVQTGSANMSTSSTGMNGTTMNATAQAGSGVNGNTGASALSSQQFQVSRIDVISQQCSPQQ
jgi:hypothetical protein